jgi:drug/metabolite transporter (DMT)-like permease
MSRVSAIGGLTAVNAIWGMSFPLMKAENRLIGAANGLSADQLEQESGTLFGLQIVAFLLAVRFALAFVFLAIAAPNLYRNPRWIEWRSGSFIGLAFILGLLLQCAGLNTIDASRSGFLTSLSVLFTPWLVVIVARRLPTGQTVLSSLLAVAGAAVLTEQFMLGKSPSWVGDWSRLRIGDVQTIISALIFSGQIIMLDRFARNADSSRFTPAMFLTASGCASVFFVGTLIIRGDLWTPWLKLFLNPPFWILLVPLVVFCSVLAFVGMNRYQPHIAAEQAAVVYTLEPIFTTLWAMFLPAWMSTATGLEYANEKPGWSLVVGGLLIALANVIGLWPTKSQNQVQMAP